MYNNLNPISESLFIQRYLSGPGASSSPINTLPREEKPRGRSVTGSQTGLATLLRHRRTSVAITYSPYSPRFASRGRQVSAPNSDSPFRDRVT